MEPWKIAWLETDTMPSHDFPRDLLRQANDTATDWLTSDKGPRRQVEVWVAQPASYEVMNGLLWSGFRLKGQRSKRVPPLPTLVQLLYRRPLPRDRQELMEVLIELFAYARAEWNRQLQRHGADLDLSRNLSA